MSVGPGEKLQLMFTANPRMGDKYDVRDLDRVTVVGARQGAGTPGIFTHNSL